MRRPIAAAGAFLVLGAPAAAEVPPPAPSSGSLAAPRLVASGTDFVVRGAGATPGARVAVQILRSGNWRRLGARTADARGRYRLRVRPQRSAARYRLRARTTGGAPSAVVTVRSRAVLLDAVGDINLGDRVASVMNTRGLRYPWSGVARELRSADVAFGNLECAVSRRGSRIPGKQYTFRGKPAALRTAARYAGMDVLNLANNHSGDFGKAALADTLAWPRRFGMVPVGAGKNPAEARRPRSVERLGLRIAFVGFSDIEPPGFGAGPRTPGTVRPSPEIVMRDTRRAARRADVVVATFHWGVERSTRPSARQRQIARAALAGGADAVIGAHPHVLQPIERSERRVVAYSLGNFVWSAGSPFTSSTGILRLRLSARGVERVHFKRAYISNTRPALLGRGAQALLTGSAITSR
ncbi:MAG: CapA family protein [Thermoleophilaceae bacterium]|nr:CapA family protein [Thermoleophilaceae bacterium]